MKRRHFIKLVSLYSASSVLGGCSLWSMAHRKMAHDHSCSSCVNPFAEPAPESIIDSESGDFGEVISQSSERLTPEALQKLVNDERAKSFYFSQDFPDDIFFQPERYELAKTVTQKFRAVQRYVGHGNFNLLGMDEFFYYAKVAPSCSEVTNAERFFLEDLFFYDAALYGFKGEKTAPNFSDAISKNKVVKIPYSGHFLRKGKSVELFEKIKDDVGESLILTSGVRGVAKQFHLFLEKSLATNGNLSKASRSLAPPGYSFHFKGDFDVGKKDFHLRNFDQDFAHTDEFKRLVELGYVNIRYTQSNNLGVRFEPWHLKV